MRHRYLVAVLLLGACSESATTGPTMRASPTARTSPSPGAQALVSHAQANDHVAFLAYWAIGADSGYHYLDLFKSFH